MADSLVIGIPHSLEIDPKSPSTQQPSQAPASTVAQTPASTVAQTPASTVAQTPKQSTSNKLVDKSLSGTANLVKLLPTGTVLAFQTISPSFTNKGSCYPSNKYLTYVLILFCSLSCIFFSFTDSIKGTTSRKIYYGIATFKGFYLFNQDEDDKKDEFTNLGKYRLRALDYVHAVFSVVVFLSLTFSDSDIQNCLFANPGGNIKELLLNLPLGAAVLASLVFMVFPTSRKGIGYSDAAPHKKSSSA